MKTKLIVALSAAGLVFLGIPKADAAITDTLTVTVSLAEIVSVAVDETAWPIGTKALSDTALSQLVTALNDGNVVEDFAIKAANGAGGWVLGAAAGADQFALGFDVSAPYESFTPIDATGVSLATGVAVAGSQAFTMQYSMPTANTMAVGTDQSFVVTVTASKTP